jgi:hypothetical protein
MREYTQEIMRGLLLGLAIIGVLACLLWAVFAGIIPVYCSYQVDSQIEQLFADMYTAIRQEDNAAAFHHMTPSYRQSHTSSDMGVFMDSMWFQLRPHYYLELNGDQAKVYPRSCRAFELMSGPIFSLVRIDNIWYFTGEYDWPLD